MEAILWFRGQPENVSWTRRSRSRGGPKTPSPTLTNQILIAHGTRYWNHRNFGPCRHNALRTRYILGNLRLDRSAFACVTCLFRNPVPQSDETLFLIERP